MTKQDMNTMILGNIGAELRDKPNVAERIGNMFNAWFQQLVAPAPESAPAPEGASAPDQADQREG